jgi:signal transduction histidine kinase
MNQTKKHSASKGRQFRLVKFFAYASFVVLVLFSFPFSVVISRQAKDILSNSYENYALLLGENLNHQVFQNFVIPVTRRLGKIKLRDKQQYEWMDRIVRNTIHSFNIDLVNVYDIGKGVIAYSTDPSLIGTVVTESPGYREALEGKHSSKLISEEDYLWGFGSELIGGQKKLRTYISFRGIDPYTGERGYVLGVFELIQDLTKEYQSIVKFQYLIIGLSILIMGLIFLALLFIVQKAEKIIEHRAKEQRELETQLNNAERLAALGQMVAGVSHEIRSPLGIIRSTAELLGGMPDSSDAQKELSGVIVEESSRLNGVVTEFLDFARPEQPHPEDCRLEEIINRNLTFLRPELEKHRISMQTNLKDQSFEIRADPEMLYRALLNVFINAIHSMKGGGTIRADVWKERAHYTLEIEDTGVGIAAENLNRIFDPFFTTRDRGSGLGLSIVRKIIESHSGTIELESRENQGTKVTIKLPINGG